MSDPKNPNLNRRLFLGAAAATVATPALAQENTYEGSTELERDVSQTVRHNISSFRTLEWQDYFDNLNNGAILVDITSRVSYLSYVKIWLPYDLWLLRYCIICENRGDFYLRFNN